MILVSSCLAGIPCRYDARPKTNKDIMALVDSGQAIPVCPERLGGLPIPRPKAEIFGGDGEDVLNGFAIVHTDDWKDVTESFVKGAEAVLKIAKDNGIRYAILRANSPSCGCGCIYNGSFSGVKHGGDGVTTALLKRNGIIVDSI